MMSCLDASQAHGAWLGMLRLWPSQRCSVSRIQRPAGGSGPHQWALLTVCSGESALQQLFRVRLQSLRDAGAYPRRPCAGRQRLGASPLLPTKRSLTLLWWRQQMRPVMCPQDQGEVQGLNILKSVSSGQPGCCPDPCCSRPLRGVFLEKFLNHGREVVSICLQFAQMEGWHL